MSVTSIKPEGGISDLEFMGISTNARKGERAHLLGLLRIRMGLGFVNGMVASHLLCHSGTINRHSLNGALLS